MTTVISISWKMIIKNNDKTDQELVKLPKHHNIVQISKLLNLCDYLFCVPSQNNLDLDIYCKDIILHPIFKSLKFSKCL
jgi:hypothetical protein